MRRHRREEGSGLSREATRLLSFSHPVRLMNATERRKSAAFVEALSQQQQRAWSLGLRHVVLGTLMVGACLAMFMRQMRRHDVAVDPEPIPQEVTTPQPAPSLAWITNTDEIPATNVASRETPNMGDMCGRRVCEMMPSCCEEKWTDACDDALIYWTRRTVMASFSIVGRCYWHDREDCPGCACPIYLKRLNQSPAGDATLVSEGYDGGTGCLKSRAKLLNELKWMCTEGYCEE